MLKYPTRCVILIYSKRLQYKILEAYNEKKRGRTSSGNKSELNGFDTRPAEIDCSAGITGGT